MTRLAALLLCAALAVPAAASAGPAQLQRKDYLSQVEADKIRSAETPALRIRFFLEFAEDRLKKFEYELTRGTQDRRRGERLNGLLNAYIGCLDDAAELIDLGRERQWDIRDGIKRMLSKGKEFLEYLEKLEAAAGPDVKFYKETLEDAILGTREALEEAEKADKEYSPPPIRRRP